ncbi:hypothetical protein [Polymorphum gilvum]|uniref:hypothetical protein n=1 Tax=Polymorphum gilvum TaxID=991904 RepID=UPI0002E8E545|nr:hypothetical protein [Polymorphum gilvum]
MFPRLLSVLFVFTVLASPIAGLAALASASSVTPAVSMQKSLCMTSGVGCGAGHILLPALGRM